MVSARGSDLRLRYMISVAVSATGRNAYFVAVAWMAVDLGKGPAFIAGLLAAGSIAEFLTSNVGGMIADRYDRRLICIACDVLRVAVVTATMFGLLLVNPFAVLFVSWVAYAVIDRTFLTTLQAMIPDITAPCGLVRTNSLSYINMQLGNLVAAVAAGGLLVVVPRHLSLAFPLACFCLSLWAMSGRAFKVLPPPHPGVSVRSFRNRDMLPTVLPPGPLRLCAIVYALVYAMGMLVSVLASALVLSELRRSALEFGYIEAFWAAGSIAGCTCVLLSPASGQGRIVLLTVSGLVLGLFLVVQDLYVGFAQMAALGITYSIARIVIDVQVQRMVQAAALGRCRAQIHTICVAFGLLVYAAVAAIGNAVPPSMVFGLYGLLMVTAAIFLAGIRPSQPAAREANP